MKTITSHRFWAILLTGGAVSTLMATPAAAQEQKVAISLPAQPLADTLRAIGAATGASIRFDPETVADLRGHGVQASSVRAAIGQAIAGTSLSVTGSSENGFYVGASGVAATEDGDIIVTAQRDEAEKRYLVRNTASSTRDGRSARQQSQATTVISSDLLRDQQVQTVAQALRNAAGATVNQGNVQGAPSYTVRGFTVQPLTGGLRDPGGLSQPIANVERVEVLKGPAALLAGADNIGGSVNIVTKKPIAQPLLDLTAEYGSYDDVRLAADMSTALDPAKRVSARLVTQYARADRNAGGYDGRYENLIAPSLRFKDETLDFTVGVDFSDVRSPAAPYGAFNAAGNLVNLSADPVGPRDQGFRLENQRFYYDGQWSPTPWLTLVSRSQYSLTNTRLKIYALAANLAPNRALLLKTDEEQRTTTKGTDTYARFTFATGPLRHTLSAGFSFSDLTLDDYVPAGGGGVVVGNLFGGQALTFGPFAPPVVYNYSSVGRQYGYYAQDLVEVGPLHLLGAVRQNKFVSITRFPGQVDTRVTENSLTPQGGAVLDLSKRLSIYGNYIQGFAPSFLLDVNGNFLPPRQSRNIEAGMKWDVMPDRLAFTAAAFRLRETNVPVFVPGSRNRFFASRGQESKGVEADLTGEVLPGWNVAASYSYATYTIQAPTVGNTVVAGQPRHRYSVFSRYAVPRGALKNLGVSAGVYGFSSSYVNQNGVLVLPSQTQVDANIYYKLGPVSLNFGVTNLLDDTVYGVTRTSTYVPVTPTRTFRLTLIYSAF